MSTEAVRAAAEDYARTPRMNVGTVRDRIAEAYMAGAESARAHLTVVELPTGPTPPCTWFVDLPCDDLAVAVIVTDRHRAGACDRCLRLALEVAAGVDRSKR